MTTNYQQTHRQVGTTHNGYPIWVPNADYRAPQQMQAPPPVWTLNMGAPPSWPVQPRQRKCLHWLHALLTFFTCGLWGFGWIGVSLYTDSANRADVRRYQTQMQEWHAYHYPGRR